MKTRVFLVLFSLPFLGVGVGMLGWGVGPAVRDGLAMQHWIPVKARLLAAQLEAHHGDDSTTYRATARYRYRFGGRAYVGDRVAVHGGSDNIGDFQQTLGRRLEQAWRDRRSITAWVNPEQPAEAVLNRDFRWAMIAFKGVFGLVFGGAGLGLLVWGWRQPGRRETAEATDQPWLARPAWVDNRIRSGAKAGLWGLWAFALFWNLLTVVPLTQLPSELARGNHGILVILLFNAVGLGLLVTAVIKTREWRRFGPTPLTLDPFPGSIGGQVGGTVTLRGMLDTRTRFAVTLTCLESEVTGSGKNRSRHEKVLWQDEQTVSGRRRAAGTEVAFVFDVPADLPASEPHAHRFHLWRLRVAAELPGVDLDRQYEIPVYPTAEASRLRVEVDPAAVQALDDAVARLLDVQQIPGGVRWRQGFFRTPGLATGLLVGGLIFAGIPLTVLSVSRVGGMEVVWLGVFLAVGVVLLLSGAINLLNTLETEVGRQAVRVRRHLLGVLPLTARRCPRGSVLSIGVVRGASMQSGGKHTVFHHLVLNRREGKPLRVAESFRSQREAAAAAESLSWLTGWPVAP